MQWRSLLERIKPIWYVVIGRVRTLPELEIRNHGGVSSPPMIPATPAIGGRPSDSFEDSPGSPASALSRRFF